jgi:hypothetical protein
VSAPCESTRQKEVAGLVKAIVLADIHEATGQASVPWTLVLDKFGAVTKTATDHAVPSLQRGRSHDGQIIVPATIASAFGRERSQRLVGSAFARRPMKRYARTA